MTSPTRRIRLHAESTYDGKGLKRLEGDLDSARRGSDGLSDSMADMGVEAKSLEAQIVRTKASIRDLGEEFERTGDTSLFGDLNKQRRLLSQMEKIKSEAAGGIASAISFGGGRMRGPLIGIVAGSLAILSPMIGAAIAGAVTGVVGVGGIAGGILTAAKEPAVKSAAKQFGADISTEFFSGGKTFVQPVIDSFGILKREFEGLDLAGVFAKTAPYVTDLAEGFGGFAREFTESFSKVLDRSGEIIPVVAQGLVRLGDGLGSMIEEMAASEGTIEGIRFLFEALAETAHAVGVATKFLGDRFAELGRFSGGLSGALEDIAAALPFIGDDNIFSRINDRIEGVTGNSGEFVSTLTKVKSGVEGADGAVGRSQNWVPYAAHVDAAREAHERLNQVIEDTISIAAAQDNAHHGLAQAMLDLREQLKEGSKDWSLNTQAGLDNRTMLSRAVQEAERVRQADIARGNGSEEATRKANIAYNKTLDKLKEMATKAGITEEALRDLVGDYYINVHIRTHGSFVKHPGSILESKGRQHGGPVLPGVPYDINEHLHGGRPVETVTFPGAGMVRPAHLTPATSSTNARPVVLNGAGLGDLVFNWLVRQIGNRGGTLAVIGIRD